MPTAAEMRTPDAPLLPWLEQRRGLASSVVERSARRPLGGVRGQFASSLGGFAPRIPTRPAFRTRLTGLQRMLADISPPGFAWWQGDAQPTRRAPAVDQRQRGATSGRPVVVVSAQPV